MRLQILTVATSMFILASGMAAVKAQQPPGTSGPDADRQVQQGQRAPPDRYSRDEESDDRDDWRGPGMMERNPGRERGWRRQPGAATHNLKKALATDCLEWVNVSDPKHGVAAIAPMLR